MCVCVCVCVIAYVVCLIKFNLVGKAPYCVKKLKISINWIVDFSYAATGSMYVPREHSNDQ